MSFIDLMADHVWSEADIVNRMEAMIRSRYPASEESIINRKITGAGLGFYQIVAEEQAEIGDYAMVCETAQLAGRAARADMALLLRVLNAESGTAELAADDAVALALLAQRAAARNSIEES